MESHRDNDIGIRNSNTKSIQKSKLIQIQNPLDELKDGFEAAYKQPRICNTMKVFE